MTGISAASPPRATKRTTPGTRRNSVSALPSNPLRPRIRSAERETHSSTPISGPPAGSGGCGVLGASAMRLSDLLRRRDAEDPRGPDQENDDQDAEHDHVLVRRRPVAD